jgi:putative Ca2+/H+ antiporter (TMEM165/GDT1 family)
MEWKVFATVFATVFLAELGDKTQLATLLFASRTSVSPWIIFSAAALALILTSAVAVAAGSFVAQHVNPKVLSYAAGASFIIIGAYTIYQAA